MAVELLIKGQRVQLPVETKIKYSKQISDIFNIARVSASHTNSFEVPKTPQNTAIMEGLGLVGSTSNIPYEKTPSTLKDSGFDIIRNGWLDVKETSDTYKVSIIDGMIDFFKEIENFTLADLDLSDLNHTKNLATVIDSFDASKEYMYIVNDYGGGQSVIDTDINIDYLVPSARYRFIIEKIFERFGYAASGDVFLNSDYLSWWLTYPKEAMSDAFDLIGEFKNETKELNPVTNDWGEMLFEPNEWTSVSVTPGEGITSVAETIVVDELNYYSIEINAKGYVDRHIGEWNEGLVHEGFFIRMLKNGAPVGTALQAADDDNYVTTFQGYLHPGDVLMFEFYLPFTISQGTVKLFLDYLHVDVSKSHAFEVDWSLVFQDVSVTAFFNDFLRRFGLTPIIDTDTRSIKFYSLNARLDTSNSQDWSGKYVRRKSEKYLFGSYAQNNYYRHKYNEDNESYNDGVLSINNQNLPPEKTLYGSFTYSADFEMTEIGSLSQLTFRTPIWKAESKETSSGVVIEYKGLTGRFYVIKHEMKGGAIRFYSDLSGQSANYTDAPFAKFETVHFADLIPKYYPSYGRLLNACKVHEIEVALGLADIINLNFLRPVYFAQEAGYYLLNKIDWQSGDTCTAELVKINPE